MVVRMVVTVRVAMVVLAKALVRVGVTDRLRWLPAREVTVNTPARMSVDMPSVPVTSSDSHPETVARSCGCESQASVQGCGRSTGPVFRTRALPDWTAIGVSGVQVRQWRRGRQVRAREREPI